MRFACVERAYVSGGGELGERRERTLMGRWARCKIRIKPRDELTMLGVSAAPVTRERQPRVSHCAQIALLTETRSGRCKQCAQNGAADSNRRPGLADCNGLRGHPADAAARARAPAAAPAPGCATGRRRAAGPVSYAEDVRRCATGGGFGRLIVCLCAPRPPSAGGTTRRWTTLTCCARARGSSASGRRSSTGRAAVSRGRPDVRRAAAQAIDGRPLERTLAPLHPPCALTPAWVVPPSRSHAAAGPLFLYVEGEGAGSPYDVLSGQHVELAANHSAL